MGGRLKDIVDAKGVVEWQRKRRGMELGTYTENL